MSKALHPQAKFDPIPPDLDLHSLVDRTPNFDWVVRISLSQIRRLGPTGFEKLVQLHVIEGGRPLVIEGWNKVLPSHLFSAKWLESTHDKKQENVRDISAQSDIPMTTGHYLRSMRQLTNQWSPTNFRDERRQRLYLKDIDCPPEWFDHLKKVIPPNVFYMNDNVSANPNAENQSHDIFGTPETTPAVAGDLMSSLSEEMRAQNLMCYVGHEGTYTPAHREMCASLGQNIMVEASEDEKGEKAGSSIWFMTETKDREVVREYFLSMLGHDIEIEKHFAQINAWKKANFPVYIVEQKVGDFILVPPLAPHQVWNRGTRTMKVAWNRTTVETLDLALHEALPRARLVCRDEQYKNKAIIYHTLEKYYKDLQGAEESSEVGLLGLGQDLMQNSARMRQMANDFRRLYGLFTEILLDEMFCFKQADVEYIPFDSNITFNGDEDTYDICMECYAMGRSCVCISGLQWRIGNTNPYVPKNTLLGHDTRPIADDRSVESIVDFRMHNLSWLKAAGEENRSKDSRRMQRLRQQADAEKAKDPLADINAVDDAPHEMDSALQESIMNGYGDQSHVLGQNSYANGESSTAPNGVAEPGSRVATADMTGAGTGISSGTGTQDQDGEGDSAYPDPSMMAGGRMMGMGFYDQDESADKILFDAFKMPSEDTLNNEPEMSEFVKKTLRLAKRKARLENEDDPDFRGPRSHQRKKPKTGNIDQLVNLDPALLGSLDAEEPIEDPEDTVPIRITGDNEIIEGIEGDPIDLATHAIRALTGGLARDEGASPNTATTSTPTSGKRRGRPPRNSLSSNTSASVPSSAVKEPKRRGRPPRKSLLGNVENSEGTTTAPDATNDGIPSTTNDDDDMMDVDDAATLARATDSVEAPASASTSVSAGTGRKRGRPPGRRMTLPAADTDDDDRSVSTPSSLPASRRRGRPPAAVAAATTPAPQEPAPASEGPVLPANGGFLSMAERMALKGKKFKMRSRPRDSGGAGAASETGGSPANERASASQSATATPAPAPAPASTSASSAAKDVEMPDVEAEVEAQQSEPSSNTAGAGAGAGGVSKWGRRELEDEDDDFAPVPPDVGDASESEESEESASSATPPPPPPPPISARKGPTVVRLDLSSESEATPSPSVSSEDDDSDSGGDSDVPAVKPYVAVRGGRGRGRGIGRGRGGGVSRLGGSLRGRA
ncbi:hypothetical protein UCREL1_10423 [Eutypa lata UCREL1]|uniref:JmjC domain-containing protein n=1 Tax=Eutypa lata (strain UCR-EL1) TaxID=1287681 RepID=M7SYK2_EUTLA|nr:hypothetical protein UCREL1_10423 [Eutypa lata UCREL1]